MKIEVLEKKMYEACLLFIRMYHGNIKIEEKDSSLKKPPGRTGKMIKGREHGNLLNMLIYIVGIS